MFFAFIDESGTGGESQPFLVISAVLLPCDGYAVLCGELRKQATNIIGAVPDPLGLGFEVKASHIFSGKGDWRHRDTQRNELRDLMLGAPAKAGGRVILSVVDKAAHEKRYPSESPYNRAFRYLYERMQRFLKTAGSHAYCVYDENPRMKQSLQSHSSQLVNQGSQVSFLSQYDGNYYEVTNQLDRIIELVFGDSMHSVGLQLADFFATGTYSYYKSGQSADCGWWELLRASVHMKGMKGYGIKEIP